MITALDFELLAQNQVYLMSTFIHPPQTALATGVLMYMFLAPRYMKGQFDKRTAYVALTIGSRYIAVEYNTVLIIIRKGKNKILSRLWTHKRQSIPRLYGWTKGHLWWVLWEIMPHDIWVLIIQVHIIYPLWCGIIQVQSLTRNHSCLPRCIWVLCQKQVSRVGTSNDITQILCPWYLFWHNPPRMYYRIIFH